MRLEHGDNPAGVERPGGGDRGADFGRVVRVVIHHQRAGRRHAETLEAPAGAPEAGESGGRDSQFGAGERARSQGTRRVASVVRARHRELDRHAAEREPRAARLKLHVLRPRDASREAFEAGLVAQHHIVRQLQEGAEGVVDVALGGVGRVMVELRVGQHGDPARELEQRAVRLVGLDHEPLARPPAGVRAGRADLATDQVAGVHSASAQRVDDHARRRRLAVGARDRDRRPQPCDLAQQVGAVQLAQPPLPRGRPLGIVGRDRAREHELCAFRHVGGVVREGGEPGAREVRRVGRAVGAADLRAKLAGNDCEAAHAGPADADKVQPAAPPRIPVHPPPP